MVCMVCQVIHLELCILIHHEMDGKLAKNGPKFAKCGGNAMTGATISRRKDFGWYLGRLDVTGLIHGDSLR